MLGGTLHILFARFQVKLIDCSRTQWENICSDVNRETRSMSIDILDIVIMSFYEFGHVHWIEYTYRSSCPKVYLQKLCSEKLRKIHRKTPVPGYACNFIKKGSSTGIFLRICEIFQNGYFIEHQRIYLHSSFCSCVRITRGTAKYKTCCFKDAIRREKKTI